jgi:hypothetical protein
MVRRPAIRRDRDAATTKFSARNQISTLSLYGIKRHMNLFRIRVPTIPSVSLERVYVVRSGVLVCIQTSKQ